MQIYNQLVISFDTLNSNIADIGTIIRCSCLLALICCYVIPTCKKTPCLGWNGVFPLGEEVSDRQVFIFCRPAYLQKNSFLQWGQSGYNRQFLCSVAGKSFPALCCLSKQCLPHNCWDTWFLLQVCVKEIWLDEDFCLRSPLAVVFFKSYCSAIRIQNGLKCSLLLSLVTQSSLFKLCN